MNRNTIFPALLIALLALPAAAKNVDLVTLPVRDSVQLTIYNSADLTLVRERRSLSFKKGLNQIQFSWANTLIDPSSVEFRPLEHADQIELSDTTFPGQKPQHLVWNIDSQFEGQAKVEVTYFTSGLTWRMDYVATTDRDEDEMDFRGYVRVFNNSGEEYENAEIRLVVGTINLVEKIADLARRRGVAMPPRDSDARKEMTLKAASRAFAQAEGLMDMAAGAGRKAKRIVKEGLSEYFMFSVEGQETMRNGWSKRMRAVTSDSMKFEILYRMREHQYGARPVRFFLWQNDDEHGLGESPLPNGIVRIFKRNERDGLGYLGQQLLRYVPVKAQIEVNLGADDLVVYERRLKTSERINFEFRTRGRHEYVHGWDERQEWVDTIRNYRGKPLRFELRRIWAGDIEYSALHPTKNFDYRTAEATFEVAAGQKTLYPHLVLSHLGGHAKQSRIKMN
ncbi:MAG: hypothetical protein V3T86_03670 [Planctomycetota bacterium]